MDWKQRGLISIKELQRKDIEFILDSAEKMAPIAEGKTSLDSLEGKVVATLFFEPSTRTQLSFQTAALRLGANIIGFSGTGGTSVAKGETLEDTIRMVESYANAIVMRNPQTGSAAIAAQVARIPVINAGDGSNEHPTQTLLDLFTIRREKGGVDGLTVMMLGDLKYGRTVHSLCRALSLFDGVTVQLYAPPGLEFPQEILDEVEGKVKIEHLDSLDYAKADVVYATRVQKERFSNPEDAKKYDYRIDSQAMGKMKKDAILMHPLPRITEITTDVDADPRAAYFRQAANGLPVRMALLDAILKS